MAPNVSVREFYSGKNILLTGGTGFMGKVLIEKLLYSIPDLGDIYVIVRPKRGKSINQRFDDMLLAPVFDRLRKENPSALKKIKLLQGDVLTDNLGLTDREIDMLSEEVTVLFHFAATLRLEAPLKDNVRMNTCGTQRALTVAKRLKKLLVFVHLSTAFCYPDFEVLGETTHPPSIKPSNVISMIEWLDDHQLALITPTLIKPHANCYTFSKRLAENIVENEYENLNTVIVRPSIVGPAHKEPLPGWVDNLNGPIGLMIGAGKGVIRTMLVDGSLSVQGIPVDVAINAIIAIGMIEGSRKEKLDAIPVYNVNVGHHQTLTWSEVINMGIKYGRSFPLAWPLWYPNGNITTCYPLHEFKRIFFHLLPAYAIDLLLFLLGQKRFMVRVQQKVSQGLEVLQFFTMRAWNFPCPNFDTIQSTLNEEEKIIYNTDLRNEDFEKYLYCSIEGGRVYCFKEDPKNIPYNRLYQNFLYVLDWLLKIFFFLVLFSFLASWFNPVKTAFRYGEPVVRYLPILGKTVFDNN